MTLEQEQIKYQPSNEEFIQPNVLQLRLDTTSLITEIRAFLMGGRITYGQDVETGQPVANFVTEGQPLANNFGVQSLTSFANMIINPSTVQGNIDREQYRDFMYRCRVKLAKNLLINAPRYGINPNDRASIIENIISMIELFVSRPIENGERDSFSNSLVARVGNYSNEPKKGFF
jgi:hypothetical protein